MALPYQPHWGVVASEIGCEGSWMLSTVSGSTSPRSRFYVLIASSVFTNTSIYELHLPFFHLPFNILLSGSYFQQ